MPPILTISIPTWNRSNLLKELIGELCEDISRLKLSDDIRILVSNNDSNDNTDELVKSYMRDYDFIRYNRNNTNIGGKSNVLKSMELAETSFVMFFGDDDRVNVNNLTDVINILNSNSDIGVLIDTANSKFKYNDRLRIIDANELADRFFWYMGNAGCFIVRTNYIKSYLSKYGYDFFNECWPQTQLMLLGLNENKNQSVYAGSFSLSKPSAHMEVMVYSSFYLWRTVVYDLRISVEAIKNLVSETIYHSALNNMKRSAKQNFLNLLQCGVFIDDRNFKKKTIRHIFKNLKIFSGREKILYGMVAVILLLPALISKPFSNLFIYLSRGTKGIQKKNEFVRNELRKKSKHSITGAVRNLDFEKNQ